MKVRLQYIFHLLFFSVLAFGQIEEPEMIEETDQYYNPDFEESDIEIVDEEWQVFENIVSDSSLNNQLAIKKGYELLSISPSPCTSSPIRDTINIGITNVDYYDGNYLVTVSFKSTCCRSFIGEIELLNKNKINLKWTDYGNACLCTCCYNMTYKIKAKKKKETKVYFKRKR